jgi:hypothetical protein
MVPPWRAAIIPYTEFGHARAAVLKANQRDGGAATWVAFPLLLLVGSVTREHVPWQLAAIHAGDWNVTLVIISIIAAIWR